MGTTMPSIATNAAGDSLAVWGQRRSCNTVTFNSLKVVVAGPDSGTGGIEPFITFQPDNGSEEQIWYWTNGTGGSNDVPSNTQFGPNAGGFPITRSYCRSSGTIRVHESDGSVGNPAQNEPVGTQLVDLYTPPSGPLTFSGAGHTIEVKVTVPVIDDFVLAGALLGSDGQVKKPITFPRPPVATDYKIRNLGPFVASDGGQRGAGRHEPDGDHQRQSGRRVHARRQR